MMCTEAKHELTGAHKVEAIVILEENDFPDTKKNCL